jgi:PIN domain nuclease of toxin-antitoxin system
MTESDAPIAAVLDASALLAFLHEEQGADRVEAILWHGVLIGTVNWAEVLSDLVEAGESVAAAGPRVAARVAAFGPMTIVPFDESQALEAARLHVRTKSLGLSLADRACLSLGRLRRLPVLTTDRAWRSLHISVKIEVIR